MLHGIKVRENTMCLRILHVVGIMNRGGTETLLMNLYRQMDRYKIQFDFVVHREQKGDYDDEIKSLGGKVFHIPQYKGINHFSYMGAWHSFFRTHPEYHIIHGHMDSTAAIYLKIAKKYGLVTIAHSHGTASRGNMAERFTKRILQYPIRHTADGFFACSKEAGMWLFGEKICRLPSFHVLNNGIDSDKFTFSEPMRNAKRKEMGVEKKFVLGHIGNIDPLKNHTFLIDVFDEVHKKEPTSSLLLVGGGNADLRKALEAKVEQRKLTDKVKFLGKRTDVNELLNAFDLFLMPSLHEGLPVSAIEAQANGLKCILSDTISHEVAVTENVQFISLEKSASFWAEQILSYKDNYERKDMKKEMQESGYDVESVAQWLATFYLCL